ncbi:MAG: fumarylacetoacetate hydrolase family protein [Dehalococcoidia bacterium]|jgi:2-keto-4-pentenoate hydratase/2-oxohepta-3-ene-1,7-dioic acid hydratase in catechol pathway
MRFVTFCREGAAYLGAAIGGDVLDLPGAGAALDIAGWPPDLDLGAFLGMGESALDKARQTIAAVEEEVRRGDGERLASRGLLFSRDAVKLLAPVPNPSKIIAIGLNYRDHAREQGVPIPDRPIIFAKFPTSVIGPGDTIAWDPALTQQVDYEAELAFVIGKTARNVAEKDAITYVAGYTCANDVSARDLQFGDRQWVRGKSLDTFCPLGPLLVTADEIPDPQNLAVRAILNNQVMQDSSTAEMIFGVAELVAFISRAFTLLPGDVVLTGTPHGVGVFRDPPLFLKDGDRVVVEIERIGCLENDCRTL